MIICHACKKELSIDKRVGRKEVCASCGAYLHCCLNCSFFDTHISKQCREPVAELVIAKSNSNYCDFFVFDNARRTENAEDAAVKNARKALDALFKK